MLLFGIEADGDIVAERDLDGDIDDLDCFRETNLFKLNGILALEDVLVCMQNVGEVKVAIMIKSLDNASGKNAWLKHFLCAKSWGNSFVDC